MINSHNKNLGKHETKESWETRMKLAKQRIAYVNKISKEEHKLSYVLAVLEGVLILASFTQALCQALGNRKIPYSALNRHLNKYAKGVDKLKGVRVSRICVNVMELRNRYAHSSYLKTQDLAIDIIANRSNILNLHTILLYVYEHHKDSIFKFKEYNSNKLDNDNVQKVIDLNSELIQFIFSIMDYRGVLLNDESKEEIVKEFVRGSKISSLKIIARPVSSNQDALLNFIENRMSDGMKTWDNNADREIAITNFAKQTT